MGERRCDSSGTWGACECGDGTGNSSGGGGRAGTGGASESGGGGEGGGGVGDGGRAGSGGTTTTGAGGGAPSEGDVSIVNPTDAAELIGVFVAEAGIFVVDSASVRLFSRFGVALLGQEMPRPVTAAAFDGELLVIADGAKLTTFDLELNELVSVNLVESCASAVMVSGRRFVCGPENDWDRIFYTYDATTGELLASSKTYTYYGIPMRRVPGTDDFITVSTDSSPSDFHLYSVTPSNGEVTFVNESPYHGDFRVTDAYAFDGAPPEHLVTDEGLMLRVYGESCDAEHTSFDSGCFVKAGALGTLSGDQVFVAMDSDEAGHVYGLVSLATSYTRTCQDGCLLQAMDVAERSVTKQLTVHDPLGWGALLKRDPFHNGVVLAGQETDTSSDGAAPGYLVRWYSLN